jgi:hypothetical protein
MSGSRARRGMPIFVVWQLSIAFLISFVIVVFFVITRSRRTMLYISRYLAIFSAIAGFSFYALGYLQPHYLASDIPNAAMRALVSTLGMFFLATDYRYLSEWLAESIWREILFWVIHLAAFIVIQAALISLFGRRIQDYCRLRFGFHKYLYIINGCTKNAIMLGEDIAGKKSNGDGQKRAHSKFLVVFILSEEDDKKKIYEKVMHFGAIVQVLDSKHNLKAFLRVIGIGTLFHKSRVFNIVYMPNEISTVNNVTAIVEYADAANAKRRESVLPDNLRFYVLTSCDLERAAIERITQNKLENGNRAHPYYFRIHSEEGLLARQIIEKEPPFSLDWFSLRQSYEFTILVLGFGVMGTNALLQILRNAQLDGSKVRALIVDKEKCLVEYFKRRYPMIDKLCCDIEYIKLDVREDECVIKLVNDYKPDYIIVSYSNDRENLELAYDISKCYSKRKNMPSPIIAVSQKHGQKEDIPMDMFGTKIRVFGNEREIYKKDIIISEDNDYLAKLVFDSYKRSSSTGDGTEDNATIKNNVDITDMSDNYLPDMAKIDEEWNKLDWVSQESERASADFMPGLLKLMHREKTETLSFDESSLISEVNERLAATEHMRWCAYHAAMGFDLINSEDLQSRFDELKESGLTDLEALVVCRKDVKNRLHACLVPWDELDNINAIYKSVADKAYSNTTGDKNTRDWKYALERDFKGEYRNIIDEVPKFAGLCK